MGNRPMMNTLLPDPIATEALCRSVRSRIHDGLHHLISDVGGLPDSIAEAALARVGALKPDCIEPALAALFSRLRDAALADDVETFNTLRGTFADWHLVAPEQGRMPRLRSLAVGDGPQFYDQQAKVELVASALADDCGMTTRLVAPGQDVLARAVPLIERACHLLNEAAPDWAAETFELVREIVLAVDGNLEGKMDFGGGSVFDLFGAILVNPSAGRGIPGFLLTLIHESSHQLLFCHHLEDEIVLNDSAALYRSPLRQQPRPMEGIFHAAWVSARMTMAGRVILAAPVTRELLTEPQRTRLEAGTERARRDFLDAASVVRSEGKLTELGHRIMDDAMEMAA